MLGVHDTARHLGNACARRSPSMPAIRASPPSSRWRGRSLAAAAGLDPLPDVAPANRARRPEGQQHPLHRRPHPGGLPHRPRHVDATCACRWNSATRSGPGATPPARTGRAHGSRWNCSRPAWRATPRTPADLVTPAEWQCIVTATQTIYVELAARFCADALNESYFGWNPQAFPEPQRAQPGARREPAQRRPVARRAARRRGSGGPQRFSGLRGHARGRSGTLKAGRSGEPWAVRICGTQRPVSKTSTRGRPGRFTCPGCRRSCACCWCSASATSRRG